MLQAFVTLLITCCVTHFNVLNFAERRTRRTRVRRNRSSFLFHQFGS